jgi:predicted nicotinamide N-methyase
VSRAEPEALVRSPVALAGGALELLQPAESAELPDDGPVEWAPIAPYWSVLWRSGVALAREVDGADLHSLRVVELGCGLAVPSLAAARRGARVLATDGCDEALALVSRNARENGLTVETALVDWARPDELLARAPFDLVLAADVLYEEPATDLLLDLLPRLAPETWLADPGRRTAAAFFERAPARWRVETGRDAPVEIHRLRLRAP